MGESVGIGEWVVVKKARRMGVEDDWDVSMDLAPPFAWNDPPVDVTNPAGLGCKLKFVLRTSEQDTNIKIGGVKGERWDFPWKPKMKDGKMEYTN
jgi:hypothetical protein